MKYADNFDLKKYLVETKTTMNSKLNEGDNVNEWSEEEDDKDFENDKVYQNQILTTIITKINTIREKRAKNIMELCSIKNKIHFLIL